MPGNLLSADTSFGDVDFSSANVTGEYMVRTDGNTYLCKQATVYTPEEYAQAWEQV